VSNDGADKAVDIAIIGGGPAGLTAALYAARGGAHTTVFERGVLGGQITTTDRIENYPAFPEGIGGGELGELMARQAETHGAKIVPFVEITKLTQLDDGTFELTDEYDTHYARSVIIATGAVPKLLEIDGEAEYTGRGVSWCSTCDGAFYRGKVIAVIGGGNAALEEALFLTKFARRVYLVHRREAFRAETVHVDRAQAHEAIEFVTPFAPLKIVGDGSKVTGLHIEHVEHGTTDVLEIDGVFEYVGTCPQSTVAESLLTPDEYGYLDVQTDGSTDIPGLFCAGDVTTAPLKQVVTAAGAGAVAGFSALRFLEQQALQQ